MCLHASYPDNHSINLTTAHSMQISRAFVDPWDLIFKIHPNPCWDLVSKIQIANNLLAFFIFIIKRISGLINTRGTFFNGKRDILSLASFWSIVKNNSKLSDFLNTISNRFMQDNCETDESKSVHLTTAAQIRVSKSTCDVTATIKMPVTQHKSKYD